VTTEAYPYGAGMTGIGAAFLAPDRLSERGLVPPDLTYAPTGERVADAARLRELRLLTRDGGPLQLAEALAKCSLGPARLLEGHVPAMRRKGRVAAGADADLAVFDPATITDQATYAASTRTTTGIRHVLVNGAFVVRDAQLAPDALPGRPVRAPH
jgi:N-acyl-D-aspartate/D-glutamate deacylase